MTIAASAQVSALMDAVTRFDETGLRDALDAAAADVTLSVWLEDVVLPFLQAVGDAWETGAVSIAHEHFASQLVRRQLEARTPVVPPSPGQPTAVLACPSGERHDLTLQCFSLLLAEEGWRVLFLGQDTPLPALAVACRALDPDLVVVAATRRTAIEAHATSLRHLAGSYRLAIAGRGAAPDLATSLGAQLLPDRLGDALAGVEPAQTS